MVAERCYSQGRGPHDAASTVLEWGYVYHD